MTGTTVAIIVVLVATTFVTMLNETSLAVALPHIMDEFAIGPSTAQWALTSVMLAMAILLPASGWLLDKFTTRQMFFASLLFFCAGSVVAAVSPNFVALLAGRVLQAVGTAIVLPLQMTVVMLTVPSRRRGTVMGLISIVMAVGPAVGPTFAGAVMSVATWHTMFWIMAGLVAVAGVVGLFKLTNVGKRQERPLDLLSVVLAAIAFGGLVYGLSSIGAISSGGQSRIVVIAVCVVSVVALALFVWRQQALRPLGRALLDLTPLRVRTFVVAGIIISLAQATMLGVANTLPLFVQGALLATVLAAGVVNLPGGIVETIISPIAGALYDRVGARPLGVVGTVVAAASLFWMSTVDHLAPVWLVMVQFAVFSLGMGLVFTPMLTTALSSLSQETYSHGSAIVNTVMQLAGAAGTAVMIGVFDVVSTAGDSGRDAMAHGGALAFLVGAVLMSSAAMFAFFLKRPAPGPRMSQ